MEPDLNLRYKSTEEMLADLEEFRKNPGIIFQYYANNTLGHIQGDHRNNGDRVVGNDRNSERLSINSQATREVPSSAIIKAESNLPKTARTPVRSPELVRDDYQRSGKKSSRSATLAATIVIILFIVGLFTFVFFKFIKDGITQQPEQITIPKFVGQKYDDISTNSEYTSVYNFKVDYVNNDTVDTGYVISQDPPADRKTEPSSGLIDIQLTVSLGVEQVVTMPDLITKNWMEAYTTLQNLKLNLDIQKSTEPNDTIIKDYVIRTEPQAGTTLTEGQTVFIIYSSGPDIPLVKVPNVMGLTLSQAISRIEGYKLTWNVQYEDNPDVPKDTVIFQDYEPDTEVPEKTEIVLTVSNGPVEEPTSSPTTTPTESPTSTPTAPLS
jgi:serine/threonine-protein kinase